MSDATDPIDAYHRRDAKASKDEALAACPFCKVATNLRIANIIGGARAVNCTLCGTVGPHSELSDDYAEEDAREQWNRGRAAETSADCHGLDTARQVFFYEQDFYVLSNFSAFEVHYHGFDFKTSEHAYHWAKFYGTSAIYAVSIREAPSAHEAFKMAERWRDRRRTDWDSVKVAIMRDILRAKAEQHEYVARKLEATGDRELVENSWRDPFWGRGPNRDGQNMLGKLWMEVRAERRAERAAVKDAP